MSYRRMLEVQARQLWRYVRGEAEQYFGFTTRRRSAPAFHHRFAMRHRILVCHDISADKRRDKVAKACESYTARHHDL